MLKFELKAVIADGDRIAENHTLYLFNKKQQLLLPIKTTTNGAKALFLAQQHKTEPRPFIHDTARRLINVLDGKVESIIICGYVSDIFYAYIRVCKGKKRYDIDSRPSDAIAIALRTGAAIYVDREVVKKAGIRVTPELLKKALSK